MSVQFIDFCRICSARDLKNNLITLFCQGISTESCLSGLEIVKQYDLDADVSQYHCFAKITEVMRGLAIEQKAAGY